MSAPEPEVFHSTLAIDPDYHEIINDFVNSLPAKIESINQFMASRNWQELQRIAHQIRGAGGGYGYPMLTQVAGDLEEIIRQGHPMSDISNAATKLVELLKRVRL